jgi:glycosyltransferase involved in cell wall biosynthesis
MTKLRIAYVADVFGADFGGGVTAGRHFVEKLREDHDVRVVATDADRPGDVKLPGFQLPLRAMHEMHFTMARPVRTLLARALSDVDVVHLQFPFWLSFAALAEARRRGVPVVAGFHVQPENLLLNVGLHSPRLNDLAYRVWINRLYGRVDAVVCPTRFAEGKLREHGLSARCVVISNGVPPDARPAGRARLPEQEGRFNVLMAGRLASEKREEDLIEAVGRSKHSARIRLVIAGGGPREAALKELARALPTGAEIGFLPRERLLQELETADLFVHCSEVELEGIVVLEAISFGLPVLVAQSRESAASELAKDDDFRFAARDVAGLTAKLDHLIDHPELLRSARDWSFDFARRIDVGQSVGTLVETYRSVIAEHALRGAAPSSSGAGGSASVVR